MVKEDNLKMTFITLEQIKAARSLLNWTQGDLANASGISKPALANFERGIAKPRTETVTALQRALEEAGVEFIEGPGVKLRKNVLEVKILSGEGLKVLWNDVYNTLNPGDERLIGGVNEEKFLNAVGDDAFDKMMKKFKRKNIKGRTLVLEGDNNFRNPSSQYRWVDESHFTDVTYYVYANKCAIMIWEPEYQIILIENKAMADAYKKQFNKIWENAIVPPKEIVKTAVKLKKAK